MIIMCVSAVAQIYIHFYQEVLDIEKEIAHENARVLKKK